MIRHVGNIVSGSRYFSRGSVAEKCFVSAGKDKGVPLSCPGIESAAMGRVLVSVRCDTDPMCSIERVAVAGGREATASAQTPERVYLVFRSSLRRLHSASR